MKKLITGVENEGLIKLMGQRVLLMCANYFYAGKLIGVNDRFCLLEDPSIVYDTGDWTKKEYETEQKMNVKEHYVMIHMIESFGVAK